MAKRRRKRRMSPAAKAASRANLVKARAARKSKAKTASLRKFHMIPAGKKVKGYSFAEYWSH